MLEFAPMSIESKFEPARHYGDGDAKFLAQLAEHVRGNPDIELTREILHYLFKQPECWKTLRTIVKLTEASRERYEKQPDSLQLKQFIQTHSR